MSHDAKPIFDITPFTTTDYEGHLSAIVWFVGCNMRCAYCYNKSVVVGAGRYSEDELMSFLAKRKGKLNAVVLSGGEATSYLHVEELCKKIKALGFKIKLDTNGSNPRALEQLLGLVDFVSLDFKAPKEKFRLVTKSNFYEEFLSSLKILNASHVEFEVRTTLHVELLDEDDLIEMATILEQNGYKKSFYIQNFLHSSDNFGGLSEQEKVLDLEKLKSSFSIVLRNFG